MSDNHSEEHGTFIKTPKQLIIAVVLAFVVPVAVIIALAKLAGSGTSATGTDEAAREEAIARNLKPAGMVVVDPNAPAPVAVATPTATASAPAAASAGGGGGKALYDTSCAACHAAGVAGAPKAGDKAAWAPRLKAGVDGLTASVIKGKGAMPPKGGAMAASDADIKAAVDYLIGLAK
jgi:cytochrome c5